MKYVLLLLLILSAPAMAQDFTHEGMKGYDARTFKMTLPIGDTSFITQPVEATFTFTRKATGATQEEADRKLAAYFAAYAESKGKSGMCVVSNGACLSVNGAIVYDLAKVATAMEEILAAEIDREAKARFAGPRLEAARKKAEADFDKEDKPQPIAPALRSVPRRRR